MVNIYVFYEKNKVAKKCGFIILGKKQKRNFR